MQYLEQIHDMVMNSTELILILVVAEGCDEHDSVMQSEIVEALAQVSLSPKMHTVCFDEAGMPWPRPLTQVLYYFGPKNPVPLFHRVHRTAVTDILRDVHIAHKMIAGATYDEAARTIEEQTLLVHTQKLLEEEKAKEVEYPTGFTMIRNFGKEMWKSAKIAGRGLPVLVNGEEALRRFNVCKGCEHFTPDARCTQCGCFMKAKVNLSTAECPLGKWASETQGE